MEFENEECSSQRTAMEANITGHNPVYITPGLMEDTA
jgi:hypothetical protein